MKQPKGSNETVVIQKLAIARRLVSLLRRKLGSQLTAAGVCGSVARGTPETYSDVDLIAIVKTLPVNVQSHHILDGTYCSVNFVTWSGILSQLTQPSGELPQILGGFGKILPIYDPRGILQIVERRAASVPRRLFRKSAELALLHSYEDFCRIKNAFLQGDSIVMKDNVYIVTESAANIVALLNYAPFASDRDIFKAYKKFHKLPRDFQRIEKLRYGNLRRRTLFKTLVGFYIDLIRFCRREGIHFPVNERNLKELHP